MLKVLRSEGRLYEYPDAGKVTLPEDERATVTRLLEAQREGRTRRIITHDANDYIDSELARIQKCQEDLAESGIILPHPGILYNFNIAAEPLSDLPLDVFLDVAKENISPSEDTIEDIKKKLLRRHQNLRTGAYLLAIRQLHMLGAYTWDGMCRQNEKTSEEIRDATYRAQRGRYGSTILGVLPVICLLNQSASVRRSMNGRSVVTSDIDLSGTYPNSIYPEKAHFSVDYQPGTDKTSRVEMGHAIDGDYPSYLEGTYDNRGVYTIITRE